MWEKLNTLSKDTLLYTTTLVVLVALTSFGLGRLSVEPTRSSDTNTPQLAAVQLSQTSHLATSSLVQVKNEGSIAVIASKNGTKYHLPTCPGAKQIAEKNKISFATIQQAAAAGYSPAANCKF